MQLSDYRDREARNQTVFREMNEWTADDVDGGDPERLETYLCECSDSTCATPILMTPAEYEGVRAVPVRFAIAVDHENPEIDRVRAENRRFATVEKFLGPAGDIARASDPRR